MPLSSPVLLRPVFSTKWKLNKMLSVFLLGWNPYYVQGTCVRHWGNRGIRHRYDYKVTIGIIMLKTYRKIYDSPLWNHCAWVSFFSDYKGLGLFVNGVAAFVDHCTVATIKHLHSSSKSFQFNTEFWHYLFWQCPLIFLTCLSIWADSCYLHSTFSEI